MLAEHLPFTADLSFWMTVQMDFFLLPNDPGRDAVLVATYPLSCNEVFVECFLFGGIVCKSHSG